MAHERKDIKPRFYPEDHERIRIVSEHDGMGMGEWIEQLVLQELERRMAEAQKACSLAQRLEAAGVPGNKREKTGIPGNARERGGK